MWSGLCAATLCVVGAAMPALAQAPSTPAALSPPAEAGEPAAPPAGPAAPHLAAGAVVEIELAEVVSSKRVKLGDTFAIRLAAPLQLDGQTVVPAGTPGVGQVVDAAPSGPLGRPAKLLLAARYLEFNGARIALKAFKLGGAGKDTGDVNLVGVLVPVAAPLIFLVHGGEIEIPAGTRANAKLAADVAAPPPAPTADRGPQ